MPKNRDRSAQLTLVETDEDLPALGPDASWAGELLDSLQLRRVRSPLEAEVAASMVASAWHPNLADRLAAAGPTATADAEMAAGRMIDAIASVRRTDALVLLVALAHVVPPPLAERAFAAAREMEVGGVRAPRWLSHVRRVEPTGAWRIGHTLGEGDNVVLGFRHGDGSEHSIVVYIDHDLDGLAKDAFLADPADETLEMFANLAGQDPDLHIEPIPLEDAAVAIRSALEVTDRDWPTLRTEDYPAIRPLLDARLSLLPDAGMDLEDGVATGRLDDLEVAVSDPAAGRPGATPHPEPVEWTGVPRDLRDRVEQIVGITDRACVQVLDAEYQTLARRLIISLARKRPSPLGRGRPEIWAGGILWALGRVNWLFARNATVHVTGDHLAEAVGAKPKSIAAKADIVGDAARIREFDPRFTRQELLDMGLFAARLRYRY